MVPKRDKGKVSRVESVLGVVGGVIFLIVFLVLPGTFEVSVNGVSSSIFHLENLARMRHVLVLFGCVGIVAELYAIYEGRCSPRLLMVTLVADGMTIALAWMLFMHEAFFDPSLTLLLGEINDKLGSFGEQLGGVMFCIILLGCVVDGISAIYRTLRYGLGAAVQMDLN